MLAKQTNANSEITAARSVPMQQRHRPHRREHTCCTGSSSAGGAIEPLPHRPSHSPPLKLQTGSVCRAGLMPCEDVTH